MIGRVFGPTWVAMKILKTEGELGPFLHVIVYRDGMTINIVCMFLFIYIHTQDVAVCFAIKKGNKMTVTRSKVDLCLGCALVWR